MTTQPLRGVVYNRAKSCYQARVSYQRRYIWLKTYSDPEHAARVRDIADFWIRGADSKQNFPERLLPPGVAESDIARWLVDAGVPMRLLAQRIPAATFLEAGFNQYDLLCAGVPFAAATRRDAKYTT